MKVTETKLEKIIPYARNPRKNGGTIDSVAGSIREFGFRQPIVCDADFTIIVGHTRYEAAKKQGLKTATIHIGFPTCNIEIKFS